MRFVQEIFVLPHLNIFLEITGVLFLKSTVVQKTTPR